MTLAEADLTSLLPMLLGPAGVTVFAIIVCFILWRKLGAKEAQIEKLNEERVKGLALDLICRQDVITQTLTAVRDSREALTKLNDLFANMVDQLEDSDGDLEKIAGLLQEVQRGVSTLIGRGRHG